jgi:hypothetical protein
VEKYCRAGQDADENTTLEHCVLDTQGYKHTLRIRDTDFPLQQWLQEHALMLCYAYIACLV